MLLAAGIQKVIWLELDLMSEDATTSAFGELFCQAIVPAVQLLDNKQGSEAVLVKLREHASLSAEPSIECRRVHEYRASGLARRVHPVSDR